jgi:hypothetical protein
METKERQPFWGFQEQVQVKLFVAESREGGIFVSAL